MLLFIFERDGEVDLSEVRDAMVKSTGSNELRMDFHVSEVKLSRVNHIKANFVREEKESRKQ